MSAILVSTGFFAVAVGLIYYVPFHISLLSINILTFVAFGYDKYKAKSTTAYRTSESLLLLLCALGGWIGGASAMFSFRHKVRKVSFLMLWALAALANVIVTWRLIQ